MPLGSRLNTIDDVTLAIDANSNAMLEIDPISWTPYSR
jgi:hypothetical protein